MVSSLDWRNVMTEMKTTTTAAAVYVPKKLGGPLFRHHAGRLPAHPYAETAGWWGEKSVMMEQVPRRPMDALKYVQSTVGIRVAT